MLMMRMSKNGQKPYKQMLKKEGKKEKETGGKLLIDRSA